MNKSLISTLALACFCAIPVLSQQPDASSAAPKAGINPSASNEAERIQAVKEFWTPERLANARPMPLPKAEPGSSSPSAASKPEPMHVGAGGRPTAQDAASEISKDRFPLNQGDDASEDATPSPDGFNYVMPFNNYRPGGRGTYPHTAVGKLFFTIPSGNSEPAGEYVCSASVAIKSYILVTARHCTFDIGSGHFYTNWVFYPGWQNGADSSLHGAWYPNLVATWVSSNTRSLTTGWDIAMMTMHDNTNRGCGGDTGRTIGSYTGWLGYSYGGDYSQRQWNIFGYPQGSPFEGNWLYQDNGATGIVDPFGSTNVVEAGDPQTGGTSGGPWVIGLDPSDATDVYPNNNTNPGLVNLANGVNSFVWTRPAEPFAINGTVFQQSNFWNLFTFLNSQTCR